MRLPVTNMCGGFLAMVYIWMSLKVGLYRKKNKISMGDNGNKTLQEMVRVRVGHVVRHQYPMRSNR